MKKSKFLNAQNIKLFIIALVFLPLIGIISTLLPIAIDWHGAFRPATLELIHGRTPYTASGFYHAPWALIPLVLEQSTAAIIIYHKDAKYYTVGESLVE